MNTLQVKKKKKKSWSFQPKPTNVQLIMFDVVLFDFVVVWLSLMHLKGTVHLNMKVLSFTFKPVTLYLLLFRATQLTYILGGLTSYVHIQKDATKTCKNNKDIKQHEEYIHFR